MAQTADQAAQIAKAFTDHFYATYSSNRQGLAALYAEQAFMTFEGDIKQGQQQIMQKLTSLPFQQVKFQIQNIDAHPSVSGGVIVFCVGQLLTEGETNPLRFSEIFHLAPVANSFVITNDIFRLLHL
jgi:ketosteroid isomerase-like protein